MASNLETESQTTDIKPGRIAGSAVVGGLVGSAAGAAGGLIGQFTFPTVVSLAKNHGISYAINSVRTSSSVNYAVAKTTGYLTAAGTMSFVMYEQAKFAVEKASQNGDYRHLGYIILGNALSAGFEYAKYRYKKRKKNAKE
jgi:hypothetical protein